MAYDLGEQPGAVERARRWPAAVGWPLVVLLGWLLFELTAQPALAVIALCLKVGWSDLCTGWWLVRRDRRRGRGWACFFLYASSAMWKITLTAFLLMLVLVVGLAIAFGVGGAKGQPVLGVRDQLIAAGLTGLLGSGLALPLTCAALLLARVSGSKLWLSGRVHEARREDRWPPPDEYPPGPNRFGVLTVIVLVLVWVPALGLIGALAAAEVRAGRRKDIGGLGVIVLTAGWLLGFFLVYWFQNYFERKVFARSPGECWGQPPARQVPAAPEAPDSPLDRSA